VEKPIGIDWFLSLEKVEDMKTGAMLLVSLLMSAVAWSLPTVDGTITPNEYGKSISVLDGAATVYYQVDASGGLYLAVSAMTTGWVGLGLGTAVMNGAHIFMGYVESGNPVFSEQIGEGHSHRQSPTNSADSFAVGQKGGMTTIEFHVPFDKLPIVGKSINFIVAFSGSADLTTYHEDNHDGGTIDLSTSN
jgi:hypothetical protein